jgi:hypothetical protein
MSDPAGLTAELMDWLVGVAFGRFDLRLATGERAAPAEPEPFDPLPVCSPGMLTGEDGLPLEGPPPGYPVDFPADGILVDDPGDRRDLTGRTRQVLRCVFAEDADARWQEAAEVLDPRSHDLRGWLAGGFFAQHIRRYSKSRRKAPIYWQLATPSASYAVWLYCHRFTRDTLYRVLNEYVTPKLQHEERKLTGLVQDGGGNPTASQRKEIADQEVFVEELRAFREEVARLAPLWNPDLDDGVIINFAALWRLVPQHRAWQRECKDCWGNLVAGDYDWAHLAMHLWPERVVPKCAEDRSLAIAHGIEQVFWEPQGGRQSRGESSVVSHQSPEQTQPAEDGRPATDDGTPKPRKWNPRKVAQLEIDRLVAERTSAAVKDALKSLLEAPAPVTGRAGGRRSSMRTNARRGRAGPRSDNAGASAPGTLYSETPNAAVLDAVRNAITESADGAGKTDVLSTTGLTDAQWNAAINALLADGSVTKTGAGRSTRYHLTTDD